MKLNNLLIVFNPIAGHKYPKNFKTNFLVKLNKYLPKAHYEWLETTPKLSEQLDQFKLDTFQRIIIIGGDGTVKNVAEYVLIHNLNISLAIIPQGSANILASSLNIPLMPQQAVKTAFLGKERRIDVGLLNKQSYFLICLAIGFWSKIVSETQRNLKIRIGAFAYLLNFLKQKRIEHSYFEFNLDGLDYKIAGNTLVVANALSLFKLKPKQPIDFTDGTFDILITKNKSLIGILTMCLMALMQKTFIPSLFRSKGKRMSIKTLPLKNKTISLDGEIIKTDKIEIEIISNKLKIISN